MADKIKNREFGMLVCLVLLIAVYVCQSQDMLHKAAIIVLIIALLCPVLYTPFTTLWFKLGELLSRITSIVILFILYFLVVTPVGWLRRIMRKDALCIHKFKTDQKSVFVAENKTYASTDLEKQY